MRAFWHTMDSNRRSSPTIDTAEVFCNFVWTLGIAVNCFMIFVSSPSIQAGLSLCVTFLFTHIMYFAISKKSAERLSLKFGRYYAALQAERSGDVVAPAATNPPPQFRHSLTWRIALWHRLGFGVGLLFLAGAKHFFPSALAVYNG